MPGFVRMTMLIIKTQQSACLTGFFCCFFLPTTLEHFLLMVFLSLGETSLFLAPKFYGGMATTFLLRRKPCQLCSLPQDAQEPAWMFLKQPWRHMLQAPWPKKQSPLCLLGAPWSLASPAASLSICPPALGSEKVLFPEMSKHGL